MLGWQTGTKGLAIAQEHETAESNGQNGNRTNCAVACDLARSLYLPDIS